MDLSTTADRPDGKVSGIDASNVICRREASAIVKDFPLQMMNSPDFIFRSD